MTEKSRFNHGNITPGSCSLAGLRQDHSTIIAQHFKHHFTLKADRANSMLAQPVADLA